MGSEDNTWQSSWSDLFILDDDAFPEINSEPHLSCIADDNALEDNNCQPFLLYNRDVDAPAEKLEIDLQADKNEPDRKKEKLIPRRMIASSCEAKSGPSMKRKRQAPNKLPKTIAKGKGKGKGKSTKKRCLTSASDVGEPSEAFKQTAPKGTEKPVKELIKTKTVKDVLNVLWNRASRRTKIDKDVETYALIILMSVMIDHQAFSWFGPIFQFLETKSQWPMRSDVDDIKKKIQDMRENAGKLDDEKKMGVLPQLEGIENDIKNLDKNRKEYEEKVGELSAIFTTEGGRYSVDDLKEKLFALNPRLFLEENATDKLPKANNHEEITATELQCYDQTRTEFTVKDMEKLEKELFDNYRDVGFSEFSGLEGVKGAEGNIPDYLKSIAKKIEEDRGQPTTDAYQSILVLVSAAVKEMEDLAVGELDWPILLKWAATFNVAKGMRFEVKFVEKLLKKNMHAYFNQRLISSHKVAAA